MENYEEYMHFMYIQNLNKEQNKSTQEFDAYKKDNDGVVEIWEPRITNEVDTDPGCFLTTACMKHMNENFDDNCYELTMLRIFRDAFVSDSDKKYYYEVAPKIVEALEKEKNKDEIYNYIYINVVDYCVKQIENKNYNEAYNRYRNTILWLEEEYVCTYSDALRNISRSMRL